MNHPQACMCDNCAEWVKDAPMTAPNWLKQAEEAIAKENIELLQKIKELEAQNDKLVKWLDDKEEKLAIEAHAFADKISELEKKLADAESSLAVFKGAERDNKILASKLEVAVESIQAIKNKSAYFQEAYSVKGIALSTPALLKRIEIMAGEALKEINGD